MQAGLGLSVLLTPRLPRVDRQRVESSELLTGRLGWRPATACAWSGRERMGLAPCIPGTPLDGRREPWLPGPCSPIGYHSRIDRLNLVRQEETTCDTNLVLHDYPPLSCK